MACARMNREPSLLEAHIDGMTHDGRGVAKVAGKTVFVTGALRGETVRFRYSRRRGKFDEAQAVEVLLGSDQRVVPRCAHFDRCGGCSLQHLDPRAQVAEKQTILLDQLRSIARAEPAVIFAPITGESWGYRRRARLGVKYVVKKDALLVGFRERSSSFVSEVVRCEVLHPSVGERLQDLRQLIGGLEACRHIPQVEVAVGDDATALVLRHLVPLHDGDLEKLGRFAERHGLMIYLQPGGPGSVHRLWPPEGRLGYRLAEFGVDFEFMPTQFVQINGEVNRKMVSRVVELLEPEPGEKVLDLFCGIGNFTLPLGRVGAHATGVEGDRALVEAARANAERNGLESVRFEVADLDEPQGLRRWQATGFSKLLLDPPRSGAWNVVGQARQLGVNRIVYVSCNPSTLARDASELIARQGFSLAGAGVIDMFPHTAHLESIALFTKQDP